MLQGYVKRQAIYACLTCCPEAKMDETKRAGVCLACSLHCHENHELIELYTKRNFRCDCGNPKFGSQICTFTSEKTDLNYDNRYNQNFSGVYCICHRPYPDPEATEEEEMIQCVICEDWLHENHLEATVPNNDQYAEMVCKACMEDNDFLHDYSDIIINIVDKEIVVTDPDLDVTFEDTKVNGDLHEEQIANEATTEAEGIVEYSKETKSTEEEAENKEQESESQILNKVQESEVEDEHKEQESSVKPDYENEIESAADDNKVEKSLPEKEQKTESEINTENKMDADTGDNVDSSDGNDIPELNKIPLSTTDKEEISGDNDISNSSNVSTSEAGEREILGDIDIPVPEEVTANDAEKVKETDNEDFSECPEMTNQDSTNSMETNCENDTTDAVPNDKDEENILDNKRKLEAEETDNHIVKKQKLEDTKPCIRPRGVKRMFKGATFWPATFRQKLCTCGECISMYKDLGVLFLIDQDDTVTAYEALGKENAEGPSSQYEKGLQALSSLDRVQQINALTEYNKMRDKLLDFLKSFKDRREIVKEEDIKAFFAGMKPKREPDGVYFCR